MRIPLKDTFLRASVKKRLCMGAGAVAIFIGTLIILESVIPADPHDAVMPGIHLKCDFIAFYTGGRFVRDGRAADLYSIPKVHAFQTQLAHENGVEIGSAIGPWWNPPFYAWVFVPLAQFSYPHALEIWVFLNILCAAVAAILLCRIIIASATASNTALSRSATSPSDALPSRQSAITTSLLVPVLMALSTPFVHALSHGQNSCTSLLIVTMAVLLWRQERAILAGLVMGLMFYKPQLGAVLSTMLVLSLGWRSLIGLGISGAFLLLATLAIPGSLHDFLYQVPNNLHFVQCDVPYLWDRHVTYKAFWRLLLQGRGAGEPTWIVTFLSSACSAAVGAALFWAALRTKKASRNVAATTAPSTIDPAIRRDRLIAATIAATPLLMPFYFDYDQLLLAISAVLLSADLIRRDRSQPLSRTDLWLMRIWPAYYLLLVFNPDLATLTHLNFSVLLLSGVAGLLIARAWREHDSSHVKVDESLTRFERHLVAA